MILASDEYAAEVPYSHTAISKVEVYDGTGKTLLDILPVSDGTVTKDGNSTVRSTLSFSLPDYDGSYMPDGPGALLAPYGNIVIPYRGILHPNGVEEYLQLGVFNIGNLSASHDSNGVVLSCNASDISRKVQRAFYTQSYQCTSGLDVVAQASAIISDRYPGAIINDYASGKYLVSSPILASGPDKDPLQFVQEMLQAFGFELYVDASGVFQMPVVKDIATAAVDLQYDYDSSNMVISAQRALSDQSVYSHVIVIQQTATASGDTYRGEWIDTDPTSPTYAYGPFGDIPNFVQVELLSSQADANLYAKNIGQKSGVTDTLTFDQIVDARIEPGDIILLTDPELQLSAKCVVDSVTIPLSIGGSQSITCRARTVWS